MELGAAAAPGTGERRREGRYEGWDCEEGARGRAAAEARARREAVRDVELGAEDIPRPDTAPARREREPLGDDWQRTAEERESCRAVRLGGCNGGRVCLFFSRLRLLSCFVGLLSQFAIRIEAYVQSCHYNTMCCLPSTIREICWAEARSTRAMTSSPMNFRAHDRARALYFRSRYILDFLLVTFAYIYRCRRTFPGTQEEKL